MADAPAIPSAPPARTAQDFAALREIGMDVVRARAAETWTDHNHHDPGVTILEATCYALTELGLKLDLPMADLIVSGASRAAPALPPAAEVLPMGPVTAEDLRLRLLDHYLVADAWLSDSAAPVVAWYEEPGSAPPLGYNPATGPRQQPRGLYDLLVAFEDAALNSNTYPLDLIVGPDTIPAEIALPYWDAPEATGLRIAGTGVTGVAMVDPATPWRGLDEGHAYFGRATINTAGPGGPAVFETWVVLRLNLPDDTPALALPPILTAARTALETVAPGSVTDRFRARVQASDAAAGTVWRDLTAWRNLGEAPVRLSVSRVQEIGVNARIEVAATTDLEERLAEIFFEIDSRLAASVRFGTVDSRLAEGSDPSDMFVGPLLGHGLPLPDEGGALLRGDRIFASDVLNLILRTQTTGATSAQTNPSGRDMIAITELTLTNYVNNRAVTSGAENCLPLIEVARYRPRLSPSKSRIVFVRDGIEQAYDGARVAARFTELWTAHLADAQLVRFDPSLPAPEGRRFDIGAYYPLQFDLPAAYGVSEAGLPATADLARRQQALQLRAYLMLIEQLLSDSTEQLASINRLFSPDAAETTSYFVHPLYELDRLDALIAAFPGGDFGAFAADPDNAYVAALRSAAEDEATALDRRNRMLDHLLGRLGEEALGWSQELHRHGQRALLSGAPDPLTLPARLRQRQIEVNRALLVDKADFLAAAPRLAGLRLQADADPSQWVPDLVTIEETPGGFGFRIQGEGGPVLEALTPAPTEGEARTRAREALGLAGTPAFYGAQNFGGPMNRRFILRSGPNAADPVVARGVDGFANIPAAAAAAAPVQTEMAALLLAQSRTALERRIDHLCGFRVRTRRPLLGDPAQVFEVFDAVAPPPFVKGWRLWSDPGLAGQVLLESASTFADPVEPVAVAAARADIELALQHGIDTWNWQITEPVPGSFELGLRAPDDTLLATAPAPFVSEDDARTARDTMVAALYDRLSVEGVHMVETLLLRPQIPGAQFLSWPGPDGLLVDPYSQRLIFVMPSGYARDFADPAAVAEPARPHRFRDREFRAHVERTIRQSCPAHLIPDLRWVDREAPGTASDPASFDQFEVRYLNWVRSRVIAGAPPAAAEAARDALVTSLSAIGAG